MGERILISPQFHRTHHALRAAGRRSSNYGTALPWVGHVVRHRQVSGTTRSRTGDAGADPAMVKGSWGEQQRAGIRRMIRLARRVKKAPAVRDGVMIGVEIREWISRVLDHGRLGITLRIAGSSKPTRSTEANFAPPPDFPCFFGQAGEARGEMLYTFVAAGCLDELVRNMQQFVRLIHTSPYQRASLISFFEPDSRITDHAVFVSRFWEILQFLHEHDDDPATGKTA